MCEWIKAFAMQARRTQAQAPHKKPSMATEVP